MADVDAQKALAAGYSQSEIDAENERRRSASAKSSVAAQDAALRAEGGTGTGWQNFAAGVGKAASDVGLGARQLAASVGVGNKEALAKEAADKAKMDEALGNTTGGALGNLAGQVGMSAVPFGMATRGAAMIPGAIRTAKVARAMLPSAGMGAVQGALTPGEEYDPLAQAGEGAAFGVGGDVLGRGVGRVLKPMQAPIEKTVRQYVDRLKEGLPNAKMLAENISDNDYVRMMTNALGQIPVFGQGVKNAREKNLEEVTKLATRSGGMEVPALTPQASEALHGRVAQQAENIRAGADLPVPGMEANLASAAQNADLGSRLFGTTKPASQLGSAEKALAAQQPTNVPTTILGPNGQPIQLPPPPRITPTIPANTAMDVRRELGDQVFQQQHGLSTRGAEAIKNEVEDALRARHGNDFDRWLAEQGSALDLRKLQASPNAVTGAGHVRPEEFQRIAMSAKEIAEPSTPFARTMNAAAARMETPSLAENRSLAVRLLMGGGMAAPVLGAIGGGYTGGGEGAATGVAAGTVPLALAAALLGTPGGGRYLTGQNRSMIGKALQSDKMKELARLLGTTQVTEFVQ